MRLICKTVAMQGHKVDSTSSTSLLEGVNGSPIGD